MELSFKTRALIIVVASLAISIGTVFYSTTGVYNEKLYDEETGLVATAGDVKKYVKSIFSASSPEYAQVSGLQFKTP